MAVITKDILEKGKSSKGGWSNKQISALGVKTVKTMRFNKGWKNKLIGSDVPTANIEEFLKLKDVHLKKIDPKAFFEQQAKIHVTTEEINQVGTTKYNCRTCFHYKGKNCDGLSDLSQVCSYWYDPNSEIIGLAYD